jgi:cytochrome P450
LSNQHDIETVLVSKSSSFIKSIFLRESKALLGDGLLISDGGLWQKQRRSLPPAFHHDHALAYTRPSQRNSPRLHPR